ncbi:hypothetical protein [Streptomyces sp. NPDC097981]
MAGLSLAEADPEQRASRAAESTELLTAAHTAGAIDGHTCEACPPA